jgi:hypothetical protein
MYLTERTYDNLRGHLRISIAYKLKFIIRPFHLFIIVSSMIGDPESVILKYQS